MIVVVVERPNWAGLVFHTFRCETCASFAKNIVPAPVDDPTVEVFASAITGEMTCASCEEVLGRMKATPGWRPSGHEQTPIPTNDGFTDDELAAIDAVDWHRELPPGEN